MKNKQKRSVTILVFLLIMGVLSACGDNPTVIPVSTSIPISTTAAATTTTQPQPTTTKPTATTAVATTTAQPQPTTTAATTKPNTNLTPAGAINGAISPLNYVVYTKDGLLYAYNLSSGHILSLSGEQNTLTYAASPDHRTVAFIATNGATLELVLVKMNGDTVEKPIILDSNIGPKLTTTGDPFAVISLKAYSLDFSSTGQYLAYIKTNQSGPVFQSYNVNVKPTEVWLSDLSTNSTKKLAPNNEKNFMYKVGFSPDNARVAFLRKERFTSDVSGNSALWSVQRDGSKLALLADGSTLVDKSSPASLISGYTWVSSQILTFVVESASAVYWRHDFSNTTNNQLLAYNFDEMSPVIYDPISHRFAYAKGGKAYSVGSLEAQNTAVLAKENVNNLLNFYDFTLMYLLNGQDLIVQSINQDGSALSVSMRLKGLSFSEGTILDAMPGNGNWIVSWDSDKSGKSIKIAVFSGDGQLLTPQPLETAWARLQIFKPGVYLLAGTNSLKLLDTTGTPTLKTVDQGQANYYYQGIKDDQ